MPQQNNGQNLCLAKTLWDLFCGVGGFGLHLASSIQGQQRELTGIEIAPKAIASATRSAAELGLDRS